MILDEYALDPDVFDPGTYSNPDLAPICLSHLRRPLMEEAVVANLRAGEWLQWVQANLGAYHQKAKNLIADLSKSGRIVMRAPMGADPCKDGLAWCREGVASNGSIRLTGIVAAQNLLPQLRHLAGPIETIERLHLAAWWQPGTSTISSPRRIDAYLDVLCPVLRHANSAMFIDPHFDPSEPRYSEFSQIAALLTGRNPLPAIEIHRVVSYGSGRDRTAQSAVFWRAKFEPLSVDLRRLGMKASVFLWDNFHDRFVITNHVGISLSNGFDTTTVPAATVVWNRMDRRTADEKQREFHPTSTTHHRQHVFEIG